jgi:hypothetical protein
MKMEMQQVMELLLARIDANMKSDQEKAETNRKAKQNSLVRMESQIGSLVSRMMADRKASHEALKEMMNANQERMKEEIISGQVEINSTVSDIKEKMKAWIANIKACQEVMEANPVDVTFVAVHEEFYMEDAAARSLGTVRKRHRGWHVAAGWRREPKKLTQGHYGSWGQLAAACRKVSRHARVAWCKRGIVRRDCSRAKVE